MSSKTPYKKGGMFENESYLLFQRAKQLRRTMIDAELILWMNIKDGIHGFKFRTQHPIGSYIADNDIKLTIETVKGNTNKLISTQNLNASSM